MLLERRTASKKRPAEEDEHPAKRRLTTQNLEALLVYSAPIRPQSAPGSPQTK
ncbi:hypothetical protein PSTG_19249 [Puccinia striiformis f. sp. tritici PST-78]|uniref:Uncharacterized protein n=1 Tax=Puccinia striiformis f. sp. tritici PST-78 TaxID=1165861 RepID=A0A0L0UK15_9BASI|nr:hypothetical protein PSTG_19249 [Puccinia striiformis f. sp. tritici PST-78]